MAIANGYGDNHGPDALPEATRSNPIGSWCMAKVNHAKDHRRNKYETRWAEYTRLWRGFWTDDDQNTGSERSRIITPALQQSVEMTVAEMEEAVFNKVAWFDLSDDYEDEERDDMVPLRDQLVEDFERDGVPQAFSHCFLLGAIYGTGIMKINVVRKVEKKIIKGKVEEDERVAITAEAVRPDEFVIDPAALRIDDALFVAQQVYKPLGYVKRRQASGEFEKEYVGPYTGETADTYGTRKWASASHLDGGVLITEYHGLVPAKYLARGGDPAIVGADVECIVTIANHGTVLKVVKNPFYMKDRCFLAYQHDTVPGEFWGRGVCEKGYNPQKANDAEIRARIDALALLSAPMMGADITKIGKNTDMRVRPGKTIFTRGRPSETFEALSFGNPAILAHTFQHAGDMERMVQVATGAMDTATPLGQNRRNETAGGMSMMQASFIKRSKRTMQNVERELIDPFIQKAVWRYVQFAPERYKDDIKFTVNATMGIMAKEVENAQLTQMLGYLEKDSPSHSIILQAIFDNTASANKKELREALKLQTKPPSKEEQEQQAQQQQMNQEMMQAQLNEQKLKNAKIQAEIQKLYAETNHKEVITDLEDEKIEIMAMNASIGAEKARVSQRGVDAKREADLAKIKQAADKAVAQPRQEPKKQ